MSWIDSPQQMWVYDEDAGMNCRDVTFVPGLYKIFDEILGKWITHNLRWCVILKDRTSAMRAMCYIYFLILPSVNAADNKQRDKSMSCIKVNIDVWVNVNTVWPIKLSYQSVPLLTCL